MTISSRLRRVALVGGAAISFSLGTLAMSGAAQAQTTHWASAAVVQAASGVISHQGISNVQPDSYLGCNAGYFCASTSDNYAEKSWPHSLPNYIIYGSPYFYPWGSCSNPDAPGCNVGIHSYVNNTGYRVWLEQVQDGGNEYCISNQETSPSDWDANSYDYWIYFSDNSAPCP